MEIVLTKWYPLIRDLSIEYKYTNALWTTKSKARSNEAKGQWWKVDKQAKQTFSICRPPILIDSLCSQFRKEKENLYQYCCNQGASAHACKDTLSEVPCRLSILLKSKPSISCQPCLLMRRDQTDDTTLLYKVASNSTGKNFVTNVYCRIYNKKL